MSTQTAPQAQTDELKTEDEALSVLIDGDIDKVMANLDRIVEAAPSYEKLISRWENQGWSTEDFDFTATPRSGPTRTWSRGGARFMLFGFSQFFLGEERVTTELLPFAIARADRRAADLPRHADRRRGASHASSSTASTARCSAPSAHDDRREPRPAAREHEQRLGAALRRHPSRVRRDACARTRRTSRRWSAGSPSTWS